MEKNTIIHFGDDDSVNPKSIINRINHSAVAEQTIIEQANKLFDKFINHSVKRVFYVPKDYSLKLTVNELYDPKVFIGYFYFTEFTNRIAGPNSKILGDLPFNYSKKIKLSEGVIVLFQRGADDEDYKFYFTISIDEAAFIDNEAVILYKKNMIQNFSKWCTKWYSTLEKWTKEDRGFDIYDSRFADIFINLGNYHGVIGPRCPRLCITNSYKSFTNSCKTIANDANEMGENYIDPALNNFFHCTCFPKCTMYCNPEDLDEFIPVFPNLNCGDDVRFVVSYSVEEYTKNGACETHRSIDKATYIAYLTRPKDSVDVAGYYDIYLKYEKLFPLNDKLATLALQTKRENDNNETYNTLMRFISRAFKKPNDWKMKKFSEIDPNLEFEANSYAYPMDGRFGHSYGREYKWACCDLNSDTWDFFYTKEEIEKFRIVARSNFLMNNLRAQFHEYTNMVLYSEEVSDSELYRIGCWGRPVNRPVHFRLVLAIRWEGIDAE